MLIQWKEQITLFLDGLLYAIFNFCSLVAPFFFFFSSKRDNYELDNVSLFYSQLPLLPWAGCSSIRSQDMEQFTSVRIFLQRWLGLASLIKLQICFTAECRNSSWQQDQPNSLRSSSAMSCHKFWFSLADYQIFLQFVFLFCGRVELYFDTVHSALK